ncbi:unnamed protein product [Cochlearia groenlandica]
MAANNRSDQHVSKEEESTRLYNPYQNYEIPIKSQYLYKLPTSPEFLFTEESLSQRRKWGENLTFYTGTAYLGGSVAGASLGFITGVKSFESGDTTKLKINRVLNSSGQNGRNWGNRLGVIGLVYAGIESGVAYVVDRDDDVWTSVVAGLGTGAVCRAARGVRSAAVAGAIGGLAAGAVVAGKQIVKRYVPI